MNSNKLNKTTILASLCKYITSINYFLAVLLMSLILVSKNAESIVITNGCGDAFSDFGVSCSLNELVRGGSVKLDGILYDNWQVAEKEVGGRRLDVSEIRIVPYISHDLFGFLLQDRGDTLKVGNPSAVQLISEDVLFRITNQFGGGLFFGFYEFTVGISYGEMRETVAPEMYASASASVDVELEGRNGYGRGTLQCTLDDPPFPGSDCGSPMSITDLIYYPVMREPKYDNVLDSTLWLRAFALPGGAAEIDQVLFVVRTIPEPSSISLVMVGLFMFVFLPKFKNSSTLRTASSICSRGV